MFQGTGSDVGKSLLVAGLARALTKRGFKVLPFKPQNMSNNAAVTDDGGEIGRAQALQARAAGVRPSVHMNPVLLKPQSDIGAQVIVQGQVIGSAKASEFQHYKPHLMEKVLESYNLLKSQADIVLVEGAGSASEVNLRSNDIANMGFAQAVKLPVILIGDIDRGGVIASLVGTKNVLSYNDQALIKGFIVNKFRGDPTLFSEGLSLIEEKTGWQSIGLVPFFRDALLLPAEDAMSLQSLPVQKGRGRIKVVVILLPHIANFDDLDPLEAEEEVEIIRIRPGQVIPGDTHMVIIPGSKATIQDLKVFKDAGFAIDLAAHIRRGGYVLGICGGYQMLGNKILDPEGIEGATGQADGLGFLNVVTTMTGEKSLVAVNGTTFDGEAIKGYEMHIGRTTGADCSRPFCTLKTAEGSVSDGAYSLNERIFGTYVHGIFSDNSQRSAWLKRLGGQASNLDYEANIENALDKFALFLEEHLNIDRLLSLSEK